MEHNFFPNLKVVDTDAFSLVESLVISASGAGVSGMAMYMLVREKVYLDIGLYRSASVLYGQSNRWLSPTRLATAASKVECPRISLKETLFPKMRQRLLLKALGIDLDHVLSGVCIPRGVRLYIVKRWVGEHLPSRFLSAVKNRRNYKVGKF